ncbi:MAG: ATP-binding protein [Pseudomonadota bacterium]
MARADNSAASVGRRVPFWNRITEAKTVGGYAAILARPAYQRLVSAEPWFKRLIPVLVITFLALVGFARTIQFQEYRADTLEAAQERLALTAQFITQQFDHVDPALDETLLREHLTAALAEHLPTGATRDGKKLFVIRDDGLIYADAPISTGYRGTYVADVLKDTQALLTFGQSAGVQTVPLIATQEQVFVALHHLPNDLGAVVIYQPHADILADWQADVSLNLSIFIGTTVLLSVVLFAFFSQSSRAEEADAIYQQSYARFDTALSRGRCGLWDWDLQRGRVFWSSSMFEIVGIPPRHALMGFGEIDELIHPDDVDLLQTAENILAGKLNQIDLIYRMRHHDGHWIWVRARGEVVEQPDRESIHLVGICIDITEQVKLSEDNKTANARLRESIETLSEAFVLWDHKNRLVVCNEKYRELNGIPRELGVPGAPYFDVMSQARTPQPSLHANIVSHEIINESPTECQLSDGRWLQVDEIRTADGGYVSIGTDITKIKRSQEALRLREQELETSVSKLEKSEQELRELADKLTVQREIAESANAAKSEFLANISHEWRTPLNAIIGFSDVMQSSTFGPLGSEKYSEYCQDINKAGTYMLAFINDVLSMSEIESGRFSLKRETFDLARIVRNSAKTFAGEADVSDVSLTVEVPPKLAFNGDPGAIEQAIDNLLSNALKFNKSGGRVTVQCLERKSEVSLVVTDSGIGIEPEALEELGKPFKQVQSQMTKNHTGSGLGLAISKSLIEMHGGSLEIQSKLDIGTEVHIKLPAQAKDGEIAA